MEEFKSRTAALLGEAAIERLAAARVAVLGLGGVGGACAEALARAGAGTLILMDPERFEPSNLNRQIFATRATLGLPKVQAAGERLLSINPELKLILLECFYASDTCDQLFSTGPELVLDAIDTVRSKLDLAEACRSREIPLLQCMGTGNRLDPSAFRLGTIEDTAGCGCGLARVMRRELKRRGLSGQPVLYSTEVPRPAFLPSEAGRHPPASVSFCPPAAGCLMASWAVRKMIGE